MKSSEYIRNSKKIGKLPLYFVSGSEYFLKKQTLSELKKQFFSAGGTVHGIVEFDGKGPLTTISNKDSDGTNTVPAGGTNFKLSNILDEARTTSMFGKYKLIVVENADVFVSKYQDKLIKYVEGNMKKANCLVLDVVSLDKRTKLAKILDNKHGVLIECNKLFDRPAPWERNKPEHENELSRWVVVHVRNYKKIMDLKTAFYLTEKTGNNLAVIDKQIDVLSIYTGDRKEITIEDIQNLLGISCREKLYHLLDEIGLKEALSAIKTAKNLFEAGMENERKIITFDKKSIAITVIASLHRRMKDLWNAIKILNNGGNQEDIIKEVPVRRPFIDKFMKQVRSFTDEEMPEKWKNMLEADLLCKTSNVSSTQIIEQLIIKLCS